MGRKSFCLFFRGIELAIEVFGMSSPIRFQKIQMNMTIDTAKANGVYLEAARKALDHLQAERQAQHERLQLAAQAKQQLDASRTQ